MNKMVLNVNLIKVVIIFHDVSFSISCDKPVSCHLAAEPCTPRGQLRLRLGFPPLKTQDPGHRHRRIDRQMALAHGFPLPRRAPGKTPAGTASSLSGSEWALCMAPDRDPPDRAQLGNSLPDRDRSGIGLPDLSDTDPEQMPELGRGSRQNAETCQGLREVLVLVGRERDWCDGGVYGGAWCTN